MTVSYHIALLKGIMSSSTVPPMLRNTLVQQYCRDIKWFLQAADRPVLSRWERAAVASITSINVLYYS